MVPRRVFKQCAQLQTPLQDADSIIFHTLDTSMIEAALRGMFPHGNHFTEAGNGHNLPHCRVCDRTLANACLF